MIKDNIYLTMTTLPERLISRHFVKVYLSLKKQRLPFYRLIINLSVNQFKYKIPLYKDAEGFAVTAKFTCSYYCLDFVTFED